MKLTRDILVLIAAVIAIGLATDAWRSARHDSQQLAATLAAQNSTIQQAADGQKLRDSQLATALAAIQAQKRTVHTPEQAATELPSVLPPLPLPVSIPTSNLSVPLPPGDTPSLTLSIPEPDLVPLYDGLQDCRANEAQSSALQKDLADEKSRSAALLHERDVALTVVHGGTFLARLKRTAKWFAIGVATGAAAVAIARR